MNYHDLRDFIAQLEKMGELKRVSTPVSPHLEMTEICDRVLRQYNHRQLPIWFWLQIFLNQLAD